MTLSGAEVIAYALAVLAALIAAVRDDWIPKVNKLALALCFAAAGLLLAAAEAISVSK